MTGSGEDCNSVIQLYIMQMTYILRLNFSFKHMRVNEFGYLNMCFSIY